MSIRDQLDRQAIASARGYMGEAAWPTVILGLGLAGCYFAVVAMALSGSWSLWIAVPLVALITYMSYTVLHESVHGSICGNVSSLRWLNRAMGFLAAWITMIPLTAHRYEHVAHHRYANDPDRDPDYHMANMFQSWSGPVRAVWQAWSSQFTHYLRDRWSDAPPREKVVLCIEVAVAVLPRLAVILAGFWVEGLALFVLGWMMGAFVLMFLFAYIVHRPYDRTGRYVDSATLLPPQVPALAALCDGLWLFQNYHSIHHLFPRVPFYRYRALYRDIESVLEAKRTPVYAITLRGLERQSASECLQAAPGNH